MARRCSGMESTMIKVNDNYLKLPGSYLFSTIGKKVNAYAAANPDKRSSGWESAM